MGGVVFTGNGRKRQTGTVAVDSPAAEINRGDPRRHAIKTHYSRPIDRRSGFAPDDQQRCSSAGMTAEPMSA